MKLLLSLLLVTLLGSFSLRAQEPQNILERPLPQPPKPPPVNETKCTPVAEDHITQTHMVDEGTTPDGVHHTRYVTDATQEIMYIHCTVIEQDVLVLDVKIPLPQGSTLEEKRSITNLAIMRFFDTLFKKGLRGAEKEYGKATSAFSKTSKQQ